MNKKTLSVILLCITLLSFLLTVVICVNTGVSLYQMENMSIDTSDDKLPLSSLAVASLSVTAVCIGFVGFGGAVAGVGFFSSIINFKISSHTVSRISLVFLCFFSAVLLFIVGMLIYFAISIL